MEVPTGNGRDKSSPYQWRNELPDSQFIAPFVGAQFIAPVSRE